MDNNSNGISVWTIVSTLAGLVAALTGLVWRLLEHRISKLEDVAQEIPDLKTKVATMWERLLSEIKSKSKGTGV